MMPLGQHQMAHMTQQMSPESQQMIYVALPSQHPIEARRTTYNMF